MSPKTISCILFDLIIDSPTSNPLAPEFIILVASSEFLIPLSAILYIPLGTILDNFSKVSKLVVSVSRFLLFIPKILMSALRANSNSSSL